MSEQITRAGRDDIERVAALIATAFCELEVTAWLVDDPADRQPVLAAHFAILLEHAADHGAILTAERHAAAVWYPRHTPPPDIPDYDQRLHAACSRYTPRFRQLDDALAQHHPKRPHHRLALLAAHPAHQHRGLGTALLTHYHQHLDNLQLPAYLEASSARSRSLYQRHGYRDYTPPITLPDHGPRLWPMWRPPAHTTNTANTHSTGSAAPDRKIA